jgi:hypothetical protein
MVNLRDLWDNKKPAAADTAPAGNQENSNNNDEEIITFGNISDAEEEAQARQLAPKQLGEGYEIINNPTPAAAVAPAALAAQIITQTQRGNTPTPARLGLPTASSVAPATPTAGGNVVLTSQPSQGAAETSESSLFRAVTARWNAIKGDQAAILQEFTWQMEIEQDTVRGEAFKQDVLQVNPRLCIFALMQENSAHIQFLFGVTTYNDVMGPAAFRGKVLGFVGDRTLDTAPEVVLLSQPDNPWKWKKCRVVFDETASVNHYSVEENRESLWTPGTGVSKEDKWIPRMILVPSNLAMEMVGKPCTPWDYYKAITKILISPTSPITSDLAALHKNWAFAAAQTGHNKPDTSLLYLELGAAVSPHKYFREWKLMMVNLALGPPSPPTNNHSSPNNPANTATT